MSIVSVTEVIEVIGYQLWRGVLWPYLAGCLGKYRSFNPENWIRRHIREVYQDDEPTLEISGIPVCQNDGISVGRYSTCPEEPGRLLPGSFSCPCALDHPGDEGCVPRYSGTILARSISQKLGSWRCPTNARLRDKARSSRKRVPKHFRSVLKPCPVCKIPVLDVGSGFGTMKV